MKKPLITIPVATLLFSACTSAATSPGIEVNGSIIQSDSAVISEDDSLTYVPVRGVFEAMGCNVDWYPEDKHAAISYRDELISFYATSPDVKIINSQMYIPLRAASETLGFDIDWDNENKRVIINTEQTEKTNEDIIRVNYNSSFAARLNELMPNDQNYVFSPLSLKYALAMAANGADDETKAEITKTLGIDDLDAFNNAVKNYLNTFTITDNNDEYETQCLNINTGVVLNIANSVWLNTDYINGGDFSDSFKAVVTDKYKADSETVTNSTAVENINDWCAKKTNDKITKIVNDSDFLSCLVNAVYLNARWENEFSKSATQKDTFTDRNGAQTSIDFMHLKDKLKYYEDNNLKMVELPYSCSHLSMYCVLSGDISGDYEKYINNMEYKKVNVTLPKFKTEFSTEASDVLKTLGINAAFDQNSQTPHFAPMFNDTVNNQTNVYIDKAIQKVYIDVNEEGTEAAAVTAITMNAMSALEKPEKVYEFKADKPFTYFIRDNSTGEILFMGEYAYTE